MTAIFSASRIQVINCTQAAADPMSFGQIAAKLARTELFAGKWVVSTPATDRDGNLRHEMLKNRGYEFAGAGADNFEKQRFLGKKTWFKIFDNEAAANAEFNALCDGI